jgi:hypothetical protein
MTVITKLLLRGVVLVLLNGRMGRLGRGGSRIRPYGSLGLVGRLGTVRIFVIHVSSIGRHWPDESARSSVKREGRPNVSESAPY